MFIENGVLNEEELLNFIIVLEGTSSLEWEAEAERAYNLVHYAPVINELWHALSMLENKNITFGPALQTKIEEIVHNIREDFAATNDRAILEMLWSIEQIDSLFPDSSNDFKNLAFYIRNEKALNELIQQENENHVNNEEKEMSDSLRFFEQFVQEAERRLEPCQTNNSSRLQNSLWQRNTDNQDQEEDQSDEYNAFSGNSPK